MVEFKRQKSLRRTFGRVRIDENDLVRLGTLMNKLPQSYGGSLDIRIVSADGEDLIRTADPSIFLTDEMPRRIVTASISYDHHGSPVSCSIKLTASERGKAELTASGTDRTVVAGVFREIEHEMEPRETPGAWLVESFGSFWFHFVLTIIVGTAIFSCFDMLIKLGDKGIQGFHNGPIRSAIVYTGWGFVFLGSPACAFFIISFLERSFLMVEFSGKLSDTGSTLRAHLLLIASGVLFPIILNIIGTLLLDAFKL